MISDSYIKRIIKYWSIIGSYKFLMLLPRLVGRAVVSSSSCSHVVRAVITLDPSTRLVEDLDIHCMGCRKVSDHAQEWKDDLVHAPFSRLQKRIDAPAVNSCDAIIKKSILYAVDDCL